MRIAIFAQTFTPQREGGAEIVARRTAEHLSARHVVRVFSLTTSGEAGETLLATGAVPVERLVYHRPYLPEVGCGAPSVLQRLQWHGQNALGGVRAADLRESLTRFSPDVIYAHNATAFQPQLSRVAQAMGVPLVLHLHDYSYLCPRTTMYRSSHNCAAPCAACRLLTSAWRRATRQGVSDVIAVSAFVRDRLRGHGVMSGARWHVLHNVEPPERLAVWAQQMPVADVAFTFGFLGALAPPKGIAALTEAIMTLPRGQARLLIGGRGDESFVTPLRAATADADVEWLGHVDANALLGRIDALVVPSLWHEPFGLVVIEGLNRGVPVVASDRGGIGEILRDHPGGILFDPDRPGGLAEAMAEAMARRSPRQAPQILVANAAWDTYFARLEQIIEQAR